MTDGKGVTCFRGCGQTIYFHDQIVSSKSGKKIPLERPVETLEEINLILSKQQEAPAHQCPNNPQQQSWGGTTKSGQFVQAKISQQEKENADIQMMLKILIDVNRNVLEILGILQDRYEKKQEDFKNLTDDEIKKIADTERIDEQQPSTQSNRSDYGF